MIHTIMGKQEDAKPVAAAQISYTPVATALPPDEVVIPQATALHHYVEASKLDLNRPLHTVSPEFADLPEAQGLTWHDDFFAEDDDVVAVFDFDYDHMESFYTSTSWCALGLTLLYTPLFMACMVGLAPCYLKKNVQWSVQAQHVAITRDGIRFVRDRRRTCWGLPCTDAGKSSKTVPFDKITDCDIEEPAGNTCLVIPNVLTVVNIDTASSGQGRHELQISGLNDARRFKRLVWAMKRARGMTAAAPAALEMMSRGGDTDSSAYEMASLLREIRDELRQNNNLLMTLKPMNPPTEEPTVLT
jgi:hypothetical protein